MKQQYIVTGIMSDENKYRHTVIATTKQDAIEKAMEDWSHEIDSIYYHFTEIKATPVSSRITELERELTLARYLNWIVISFSLIVISFLVFMITGG
jgi:hypothetical protein